MALLFSLLLLKVPNRSQIRRVMFPKLVLMTKNESTV